MSCEITSTIISGEAVIDVAGRLCYLELTLRGEIEALLKEGNRNFALNLSNLSYLDSFGLEELLWIRNSIERAGGKLKLLRPPAHAQKLFQITKLDAVFDIANE